MSGIMKREIEILLGRENVRVSFNLPLPLLDAIDAEAERIGIRRSALVEYWLSQRIGAQAVAASRFAGLRPAPPVKSAK